MIPQNVRNAGWRAYADLRRTVARSGSARSALASLGDPKRDDLAVWNCVTDARHDEYRTAHPPVMDRVAIVCVSMRPHLLDLVIRNATQQLDVDMQLVFVANSPGFDRADVDDRLGSIGAIVDHPPAGTSLGAALNRAMGRTDARFVAKMDDDDLYGPNYLDDALRAHGYAGSGVVGKHSYFARFAETGSTYIRFPRNEFRSSGTLAGGTLVIDRDRVGDQQFEDISLGEDRAFLARCHRRGIATFSADRFNFVQMRTGNNTWRVDAESFLRGSVAVDEMTTVDR
jgi:hypothetical protein